MTFVLSKLSIMNEEAEVASSWTQPPLFCIVVIFDNA